MTLLLQGAVLAAALVFIAVSAMMNALFLSSLGRTPVEINLLAAVSVAADIAKAALPVVVARALVLRAWGQASAAAVMLLLVILLSLASGTGFAAITRGAATSAREAQSERLGRLRTELAEIATQLAALGAARPAAIIEAELATAKLDRRWSTSKSCTEINGASVRQYCGEVLKLQHLGRHAELYGRTIDERRRIVASIEAFQERGVEPESDHQAAAIAKLFRVDRELPRVVLTSFVAVTLELGSILLVLLAAGPALLGWREPGTEPTPPPILATLPVQADRSHWQRQRGKAMMGVIDRVDGDGRQ
jgi:hypothetical protein